MLRKLLYTVLLLIIAHFSYADENDLDKIVFNAAVVNNLFPQERVYLHFDNSAYYLGETMWFKAYCVIVFVNDSLPLAEFYGNGQRVTRWNYSSI